MIDLGSRESQKMVPSNVKYYSFCTVRLQAFVSSTKTMIEGLPTGV